MGSFHPFDTYISLPRSPETWVVKPLLPAAGKLNIYSAPKVGKSWASIQLAADVAAGKPDWLGFPIHLHGDTLYLQLDTPRSLWVEEYLLKMKAVNYPTTNGTHHVHLADREDLPSYPFDIRYRPHGDWLREQVDKIKPVMVVIDTFKEAFRGNENDADTEQDVVSALTASTHPAALVIITHQSKPGKDRDGKEMKKEVVDGIRGSSYLSGSADGIIHLSQNNTFTYISRTTVETKVKMTRLDSGLWAPISTQATEG
jgi:RecA-family ATPase